jgi:hypothetical protein
LFIRGESFCPLSQSTSHERGRKCDVRFLGHTGIDLGEWEFSAQATPTKAIEDRCRSARINQSILNGLLSRDLTDTQVSLIKVPYLQIAGVFGQLLVEDLVNGFYVVYPGPIFEIPTRLNHIRKLKSVIMSFKHVIVSTISWLIGNAHNQPFPYDFFLLFDIKENDVIFNDLYRKCIKKSTKHLMS